MMSQDLAAGHSDHGGGPECRLPEVESAQWEGYEMAHEFDYSAR